MNLPAFVLACPATLALIVRAKITGELPNTSYDAAWDALDAPEAYQPAQEVQDWVRAHWHGPVFGAEPADAGSELAPVKIGITEGEILPFSAPSRAYARSWMPKFLEVFVSSGGNTTMAAAACNISRDTPRKARKVDAAFDAAFSAAEAHIADAVRTVLYDRAVNGWQEPVYGSTGNYQDGLIGSITKFDNSLLKYLAQARCEEFKQASKDAAGSINVSASASASATTSVTVTPEKMTDLQARHQRQLEKQAERDGARAKIGKN